MDRFVKKAVAIFLAVVMLLSTAPVGLIYGSAIQQSVQSMKLRLIM